MKEQGKCGENNKNAGNRHANKKRAKATVGFICALACAAVIGLAAWVLLTPLSEPGDPEGTLPEQPAGKQTDGEKVHIGDTEINYVPGEYGSIVCPDVDESDFSSKEAAEEYKKNWHDSSWKGEVPASGRDRIAHYELDESAEWVDGELIAVFAASTADKEIKELARQQSYGVDSIQKAGDEYKIALFYTYNAQFDPLEAGDKLQKASDLVKSATPNIVSSVDSSAANDPGLSQQSYVPFSNFDDAWLKGASGKGTTIAILDSGICATHADLSASIDFENAYDAIERGALSREFKDTCGHGTVVSGVTAASANNGIGIAGCSFGATILPIRVLNESGKGDLFDIGEGLGHLFDLEAKPDVVNMSFGMAASEWWSFIGEIGYGIVCQGRINELSHDHSVVFVAAAGNERDNGSPKSYPAALDNVISVSAVDENRQQATFSSANETVDVCALGTNIYSTVDGNSKFGNISNPYAKEYLAVTESGSKKRKSIQGTSFAAPQVAAAAALLRAQHPSWTAKQIENRLESTAVDLGDEGRDDVYGHGLLDAQAACAPENTPKLGGSIADAYRKAKGN